MISKPLDLIYAELKKTKKSMSYESLWNSVCKNLSTSEKQSNNELIAEVYSDLVLDNRFVLTKDGLWILREFIKFDDIKKQYDYVDNFDSTEDFDDTDLKELLDEDEDEDEEIDSELDYTEDKYDDETDEINMSEVQIDEDEETIADKMGITEELDWNQIEKDINENN